MNNKLMALLSLILIALSVCGVAYSHWSDTLHISGTVTTGKWKACIRIQKTLDGAFTDPYNGEPGPRTDLIHRSTQEDPGFPTRFKLTIMVVNDGCELTDVVVTDVIENQVAPRSIESITVGTVSFSPLGLGRTEFGFDHMTWNIGYLAPGASAQLEIWIETLPNPAGKYAPTEEYQNIPINRGATVTATSLLKDLSTTTQGITLNIVDDREPDDNLARIDPPPPLYTPWAEDRFP